MTLRFFGPAIVRGHRDHSNLNASHATEDRYTLGTIENMKKNPLNKGIIMENADGVGTVTPAMVDARAGELARIDGRSKPTKADYQQAKRELTGEEEIDPQEEKLASVPESEGWDPVPGSTGRQAAESLGEDEDAEGRSEAAQMYEEGIDEAEHDQMRRAAEQEDQRDQE